jgi:hypothetical protein
MIKGRSTILECVVYSKWTGQASTSIPANLASATVKCYIKKRPDDDDTQVIIPVVNLVATITDAVNGLVEITVAPADTNVLSYQKVYFEVVAKTAGGAYIGNGVGEIEIKPNVGKTLF